MKTLLSSITLAVFLLTTFNSSAQIITKFERKSHSYLVGETIHHYRDLGKYFDANEAESTLYKKSIYQLNQARVSKYITLGTLALGVGLVISDLRHKGPCEFICISTELVVTASSFFVGSISAIVWIASTHDYKSKRRRLIDMYNSKFDLGTLRNMYKQDYSFSPSNSGIGIVMNF